MFFDIGWSELLVIALVTLIVVGPKQMPFLLRTIGRYVGIAKKQAAEFQNQVEQAIKEAELDDIKKEVTDLRNDLESTMEDTKRSVRQDIDNVDEAARSAVSAPAGHEPTAKPTPTPATASENIASPARTGDE